MYKETIYEFEKGLRPSYKRMHLYKDIDICAKNLFLAKRAKWDFRVIFLNVSTNLKKTSQKGPDMTSWIYVKFGCKKK